MALIDEAICGMLADVEPIKKAQRNREQGFMFRGIDDVYNAVQPLLAKHRLYITSEILEQTRTERTSMKGTRLGSVILKVRYTLHASDGSIVTSESLGEAMDSGDKGTSKALSIAFKYALFQLLCIPTEVLADPDAETHDVKGEDDHKPAARRPPGTVSRKETQPDHKKADAALEEAGKEVFGGEPSKFALACKAIPLLATVKDCRDVGERIMELQRHGELTVAEAEDLDLRRIARMNELTDAEKPPARPTIDAEWWKEYGDLLAQAVDLDAVARVRDYHSGQVVTPTDLLRVTEMADGRFAALAAKPKGKAKQAALIQ